jgi:glucans biosynthesis protein C
MQIESGGWNIFAMIGSSALINPFMFGLGQIPEIQRHWGGDAVVWSWQALAMLAGVFFHAALAHSPLVQPFFPTADASQAPWLDAVLWPLHLVRMPLFFAIAGVFAALTLSRHGMGGLMRSRARRLGLPLLWVSINVLLTGAVEHVQRPSPLLHWLRGAGDFTPPLGTGHLWFVHYLLLFMVLLWAARLLLPLALRQRLRSLPLLCWLLGLPLLLAPALASVPSPHPAPEGLLPQFWALACFGGWFAMGFSLGPLMRALAESAYWVYLVHLPLLLALQLAWMDQAWPWATSPATGR